MHLPTHVIILLAFYCTYMITESSCFLFSPYTVLYHSHSLLCLSCVWCLSWERLWKESVTVEFPWGADGEMHSNSYLLCIKISLIFTHELEYIISESGCLACHFLNLYGCNSSKKLLIHIGSKQLVWHCDMAI